MTTTNSIGATGRDYSTIEAWEAATDGALSDIYVGECYHDGAEGAATFTLGSGDSNIILGGATGTSASRYRHLKAAAGHKYDPVYQTGVWIERTIGTASEAVGICLYIQESYFKLTDMAIKDAGAPTSGFSTGIRVGNTFGVEVSRCYVKWSTGYADGTAGTAYSDAIRVNFNSVQTQVDNCIVEGGGALGNRGCTIGIRLDSTSGTHKVMHCTVLDVKAYREDVGSTNRGISGNGASGPRVSNNICINCSSQDADTVISSFDFYNLSTDSGNNISADSSAGYVVGASNTTNAVKGELFVSAVNRDLRNLSSSPAISNGATNLTTATDFAGNARSASFVDIGAYEGYIVGFEGPPTAVISSISSTGDYTTIAAWEAATDNNHVENNEHQIGELYDEAYTLSAAVTFAGSISESPRKRTLRVAEGNEYDPATKTGARVLHDGSYTGSALIINERDFTLSGPMLVDFVGVSMSPSAGSTGLVQSDADACTIERLFITGTATTSLLNLAAIRIEGGIGSIVRNCVMWGHANADSKSINAGVLVSGADTQWLILHNTVYGVDHPGTTSIGFVSLSGSGCTFANNISIGGDFDYLVSAHTLATNISGDSTGQLPNNSAADVLADASGLDFWLAEGSPASIAGTDYLSYMPNDMAGSGRRLPATIGAFESARVHPQPPDINQTECMATLFEITRLDGEVLRITDNTSMLRAFGYDWVPMPSQPTARRAQSGLTPSDFDYGGVIDSDLITTEDLVAGRYSGAMVREYLVDYRYPWMKPYGQHRYRLGVVKFDRAHWTAEAGSYTSQLRTKRGRLIGRVCDVGEFGGPRCNAAFTLLSGSIDSVKQARKAFYVNNLGLTNDWYAFGELTLNGQKYEVRSNTLVDVNLLAEPEDLSAWTQSNCFDTINAGSGPSGNDSYDIETTANSGNIRLQQGTWADRSTLVLSVYVDRPGGSDSRIIRLALWEGTSRQHFVDFYWTGTTWQAGSGGVTLDDTWGHRLYFKYKADGTETGDLYAQITLGESSGELLTLALPQLEEDADAATKWVDAQRCLVVLAYPTNLNMSAATTFTLKPGCDRLRTTCKDKHNNLKNFKGFPSVPGTKKAMSTPLS
jgi:uncharacterized phage protein (TIGR02218 family)